MNRDPIQHDLSRKLQQRIAEVLLRETTLAQHVLGNDQVSLMVIEAAVSLARTAAATIAASVDGVPPDQAFDDTLDLIHAMAKSDRDRSLATVSARRAQA